ncbi:MAG: phosphonate C-P lyase system protein PhnG [Burkholderiaceae bacterium]
MRIEEGANAAVGQRQRWMRILARAGGRLRDYGSELRQPGHRYIRPAETGMVMVRGRTGGSGAPFNLGEMTVTRCVVQLADGSMGYSYVAGRSKPHAELAALADALLQGPQAPRWMVLVDELEREQAAARADRAAQSAATKVDFTTLVRGED